MKNLDNHSFILKREDSKSLEKPRKEKKTHKNYGPKKANLFRYKSQSHKNHNIILNHQFDKMSLNKAAISNHKLNTFSYSYKKDLFKKLSEFLDKRKFKLSNKFDEKHSKKFLDKKDKCLERIILSDIIENNVTKENNMESNSNKFGNKNNFITKYYIIISNYDDELKDKKLKKRKVNMTKIY